MHLLFLILLLKQSWTVKLVNDLLFTQIFCTLSNEAKVEIATVLFSSNTEVKTNSRIQNIVGT